MRMRHPSPVLTAALLAASGMGFPGFLPPPPPRRKEEDAMPTNMDELDALMAKEENAMTQPYAFTITPECMTNSYELSRYAGYLNARNGGYIRRSIKTDKERATARAKRKARRKGQRNARR